MTERLQNNEITGVDKESSNGPGPVRVPEYQGPRTPVARALHGAVNLALVTRNLVFL